VFSSDYYYFSQQICAAEPYMPGLQVADNLRLSNLDVGKWYYYLIRASSRVPYRNSNSAVIPHRVLWQSSVDGKVTLSPDAGGLPVEEVLVEYRLTLTNISSDIPCGTDHNSTIEGWCEYACHSIPTL
jgi:hypothetical protein